MLVLLSMLHTIIVVLFDHGLCRHLSQHLGNHVLIVEDFDYLIYEFAEQISHPFLVALSHSLKTLMKSSLIYISILKCLK